ncbi:MAG TPA: carbon monoxide dehydrogenase subunit G [Thermoanaerobaculia bacterium]|nr:carbon monoxide dehydrogenase subunit G [Thermoanaerobaculia bacterium]
MKLSGQHLFDVDRDRLWQALLDPEVLAKTLPGTQKLERIGENEYRGSLLVKVGPVQGAFDGGVKLFDLDPPHGYRMEIEGRGAPGFLKGIGRLELEARGAQTNLRYEIDAQVGGRVAAVGQRLIESSAKVITRQGLEGLERQLAVSTGASPAAPSAPPDNRITTPAVDLARAAAPVAAAPPSQTRLAGEVVQGVFDDLVPTRSRWPLVLAALFAVVAVVAILLRTCGAS